MTNKEQSAKQMEIPPKSPFGSNAVRLGIVSWIAVLLILMACYAAIPIGCSSFEIYQPATAANYRHPNQAADPEIDTQIKNDYWLYKRWIDKAVDDSDVILIGDSYIWGVYAENSETLSAYLNAKTSPDAFANGGVLAMHPIALSNLMEHYGKSIRQTNVIYSLNPVWWLDRERDLSAKRDDETEAEAARNDSRINHPELIPQLAYGDIPYYKANFNLRFGRWLTHRWPTLQTRNHINLVYTDGQEMRTWMNQNPLQLPFLKRVESANRSEYHWRRDVIDPFIEGMKRPDSDIRRPGQFGVEEFDYVPLDESSVQWLGFKKTINTIQKRDNGLFVLVGPFNVYLLTGDNLQRYQEWRQDAIDWLDQQDVDYYVVPDLERERYPDASHTDPLGYDQTADLLLSDDGFRGWLRNAGVEPPDI